MGSQDPSYGDIHRTERLELHTACIAYLTMQLEMAAHLGVAIWEDGHHLCTLYPHAWGHADDRAEVMVDTATSTTYTVQYACPNCLVPRKEWADVPPAGQGYTYWDERQRFRAQHLQQVICAPIYAADEINIAAVSHISHFTQHIMHVRFCRFK